jgi:hypothetical protein
MAIFEANNVRSTAQAVAHIGYGNNKYAQRHDANKSIGSAKACSIAA